MKTLTASEMISRSLRSRNPESIHCRPETVPSTTPQRRELELHSDICWIRMLATASRSEGMHRYRPCFSKEMRMVASTSP